MSLSEVILILLVALFVLRREHLPGVARFFGKIVNQCQYLIEQFNHTVNTQLNLEKLDESTAKAEVADKLYQARQSQK